MLQISFRKKSLARIAVFCLGSSAQLLLPPGTAFAASTDWSGGTGSWFSGGNWTNGIPGASDTATIGNGGTAQINAAASVQTLNINSIFATRSTLDLQSGGSLSASGGIFVGTGPAPGTLLLSGSTNVTGPITLANAIIQSNITGTLSSAITIDQSYGAFVDTLSGTALTLAGPITGGSLVITGGGTTIFTGVDTTTGGTVVQSGATLQIGNGGTGGTIGIGTVSNFGILTFSRSDSLTIANVLSGSGAINIASGTLIYTGTSNDSGLVTIAPGATLQLGNGATGGTLTSLASIVNNGTLVYNHSVNFQVDNAISGTGSLIKAGSGTVALVGTHTYSGGTTVSAGTLNVLGSISSTAVTVQSGGTLLGMGTVGDVTVQSGGTLVGLGNVGAVTVQSGGTLAPGNPLAAPASGNSVGALTVNGNLVLAPSSTYSAVFGYGSTSGWTFAKTTVTGAASIAGTLSLELPGFSGFYTGDPQYTLISSSGTLSGSFSSVSAPGLSGTGFHVGGVSYDAHNVYLSLVRDTYIWSATPVSSDWSTASNWQNGAVPQFAVVQFGATNQPTVTFRPLGNIEATSLVFEAGAPAYSFTIANPAGTPAPPDFAFELDPCANATACAFLPPSVVLNLTSGIVDNSSSPPSFLVGGVLDPSVLSFVSDGNAADASITAAAFGKVTFRGSSDAGPAAKLTALRGGVFDFSQTTGPNGDRKVSAGSISGAGYFVLGGRDLTVGALNTSTEVSGVISGDGGSLTKVGTGTLTLSGVNTYTGGTTISAGTLQIGNGGTTGSVAGGIANNAALAFNRSDAASFASVISGVGTVAKLGTGNLTLSGTNTYSGTTTVSAGTLTVTGAIASSSVSVANSATLGGTGTVGTTTVASGGILAPGNSIGTLNVNGNLTLAAGSAYSVEVSPTAADRTMVSGNASINGTVITSIAAGTYAPGQRYTLLTATSGVSGTFASLTGIPASLKGQLSYDTNNAYLTLSPNTLAPSLPDAPPNQQEPVGAIDAAVTSGNVPPAGFQALYSLSGTALNGALDQISGQVGANTINAVGQASLSFLNMTAQGGSGDGNFAPGSAFGGADAPHRAQLGAGETRVWGAAYGGHVGLSADAATGAASLSASNVGLIGGVDMAWDEGLLAGVTFGLGRQNFSSGNGTGTSDDIMIGVYARKDFGPLYVTAAIGYGSHHIETLRVITVSGTDVLQGKQHADDYGGRIEAGWRTALDEQFTLSPYFAVAAQSFESAAYAESALSGAPTFALSVAARSSTLGRTELGSGLSRDYETENGVMTADLRLAWAHQLDASPITQASFQTLPGASFLVTGVRPASDTALLGAGIQVQNRSGLFFGFKGESQLGAGTTILQGMGHLGWRW